MLKVGQRERERHLVICRTALGSILLQYTCWHYCDLHVDTPSVAVGAWPEHMH
jgi:hypothetical protein